MFLVCGLYRHFNLLLLRLDLGMNEDKNRLRHQNTRGDGFICYFETKISNFQNKNDKRTQTLGDGLNVVAGKRIYDILKLTKSSGFYGGN